MAINTSNYNLKKPSPEDFYNIEDQNVNMDIIDAELNKLNENKASVEHNHNGEYETPEGAQSKADAAKSSANQYTDQKFTTVNSGLSSHLSDYVRQPGYAVTSGTANAFTITLNPAPAAYTDGMAVTIRLHLAGGTTPTLSVNGLAAIPIVDSKNSYKTGLKQHAIYTLRYNGATGTFMLQGEGGEYGTAGAAQVLSGYTVGTDNGLVSGSIPIRTNTDTGGSYPEAVNDSVYDSNIYLMPPAGYYDGNVWVHRGLPGLIAANIRQGVTIGTGSGGKIVGSFAGKRWQFGTTTLNSTTNVILSGLPFKPSRVYLESPGSINYPRFKILILSANPDIAESGYYGWFYVADGTTGWYNYNAMTNDGCVLQGAIYAEFYGCTWYYRAYE